MTADYSDKYEAAVSGTLFPYLCETEQAFVRSIAFEHRFTAQELRQVAQACRDLAMWQEGDLQSWWRTRRDEVPLSGRPLKKRLLHDLQAFILEKSRGPKSYPDAGLPRPEFREQKGITEQHTDKQIAGMCPVASEETVCCNLRTIDAVENCAFGCSYCTIQTFYNDTFVFDAAFAEKLQALKLDPDRFYHFGTGQSSDSLVWGNKFGALDALCKWAGDHPNILLEFKTKSDNIRYFFENDIPPNIVCSWSLNTPTIVANEEHFTASLEKRITAARKVADLGVKVSFHFHPMVYYQGWEKDYPEIAARLLAAFSPTEVLFISMGSITMIKPAMKKIRRNGHATKILQMEMTPDPHGKLTYPDDIKVDMFKTMYKAFAPWQRDVFFYLCMEKAEIWRRTFGRVYSDNETFERDFLKSSMRKIQTHEVAI